MKQSNKDIIIFLGAGKIFISDGNRVLQFEIPNSAIKDWDLVNKESLQDTLNAFIAANKFEPSDITFVLSGPACFSQDIMLKDPSKLDEEVDKFNDAVPFNYLISKAYKIGGGVRVIAANKDLVDAISEVFEGKGFPLFAVVPAAIFPEVGTKKELDMQFVKAIGDNRELIQTGNMIVPKPIAPEIAAANAQPAITTNKASSGYLPYLIGVGVLAIIILVGLVFFMKR